MANKKEEILTPLWSRLTFQIQTHKNIGYDESKKMAKNILIKRGHLNFDGTTKNYAYKKNKWQTKKQ